MVDTLVAPLVFNPEEGQRILSPETAGTGYWVGCPAVIRDGNEFLITYRRRRPRGADSDRGFAGHVARSADGVQFTDIWTVTKEQLQSPSMERFDILKDAPGRYLLYISYVDPEDQRWRIDVLEAASPDAFSLDDRRPALTAATTGTEGVKDPVVVRIGAEYWMFVSFADAAGLVDEKRETAHSTGDIYNTGTTTLPTGLAVSRDGLTFEWQGLALPVGASWDRYQARLTSVIPLDGRYLAYYDGSASVDENYEERCGLASSEDGRSWQTITPSRPAIQAASGSHSVRYVDALRVGDELWCYFEYAAPDGSHETRLTRNPFPWRPRP